jgi:hydroxypyruvate reductase
MWCCASSPAADRPLLVAPLPGLSLEDKQAVNRELLRSGASIGEMNCVRRHLSAIKGGRLAAACHPSKVVTLLLSDVPGDRPMDIASGPTVPDPTTCADALAIVKRYGRRACRLTSWTCS